MTLTGITIINDNVLQVNKNFNKNISISQDKIDSVNMKIDFLIDQVYYMKEDFDTLKKASKKIYNTQKYNQYNLEKMNKLIIKNNQRP